MIIVLIKIQVNRRVSLG